LTSAWEYQSAIKRRANAQLPVIGTIFVNSLAVELAERADLQEYFPVLPYAQKMRQLLLTAVSDTPAQAFMERRQV